MTVTSFLNIHRYPLIQKTLKKFNFFFEELIIKRIIAIIVLTVIQTIPIQSFTPGKWSPLDRNVLGIEQLGPASEIVKNGEGKIIYTAYYDYDTKGRLSLEKFLDIEGKPHGETRYIYDKERILSEETFTATGLLEKRIYRYNSQGDLKEVQLVDSDGKEIQKCKVSSMNREFITDGELKWVQSKDIEIFQMKKMGANEPIWIQEIVDDKKKQVATIKFHFDEKGRLIKRENIQASSKRKSELKYDESGRLIEFSYFVMGDTNWNLQKIHYLSY
jgi:antitoxin component YwqK of YwqJK toxin-antitoxin module